MSRILLIWELGERLCHVGRLLALAQALRQRGHQPILCLRELSAATALQRGHGLRLLQAPLWQRGETRPISPFNYGDILRNHGFGEVPALACMINAWRNLFALTSPHLMIFDHAPSALLASRNMHIPRALIGTGFYTPPRITPFPPMRGWISHSRPQLASSDATILAATNRALERNGLAPLKQLHELFDVEENFLCTFAELDPYPQRAGRVRYWGAGYVTDTRLEPDWPKGDGPRVFACLDKRFHDLEKTLRMLDTFPARTLIYAPGLDPQLASGLKSARLCIATAALDPVQLATQCDICVCHAGHGVASTSLLAGVPLLMLPNHLEQQLTARNIQKLGAGLMVLHNATQQDYADALQRLLSESEFRQSARAFSAQYATGNPQTLIQRIADRCEELMARAAVPA